MVGTGLTCCVQLKATGGVVCGVDQQQTARKLKITNSIRKLGQNRNW